MEKEIKFNEATARRLYKSASPEFKDMLEENFGKEFFNEKVTDKIKSYADILSITGTSESDDEVKVKGFNDSENELVKNLIKKIRIVKVYNEGWIPKRGERRHHPYYDVSSGFVFYFAGFDSMIADTSSASRLCFKNVELTKDYANKFGDVEQKIIDIH